MDQNKTNTFFLAFAILAAGLIIGAAIYYKKSSPPPPSLNSTFSDNKAQEKVLKIEKLGRFVLGNPEANLVMIEWADYQCPFCGKFYKSVEREIIDKYVKTGKLRFEYRDFAFLGEESRLAAEAARCADEQGKFWKYHDYLYEHQNGENQGAFSKENLKKFAKELNLDTVKFNLCLNSKKYKEDVIKSFKEAVNFGVVSTPTIIIGTLPITIKKSGKKIQEIKNGDFILGAYPLETFEKVIGRYLQ